MKMKSTSLKIFLLFITFVFIQSSFLIITPKLKTGFTHKEYKLRPSSILEVNGKTNINSFSCTSRERALRGKLSYQLEAETTTINFQNTKLKIAIQQLDCGAKAINKDLHKALQSDGYPNITIDLIQLFNLECKNLGNCDSWVNFEAVADIIIVCTSKSVYIPVQVKKLDDFSYRIRGSKNLELCDFGIEPPTAMMGLIKVKNKIEINFDLFVDLE